MARPWIKLHAHMLHHPGIGQLSDRSYRAWITMLLMASQAEEPGVIGSMADVAWQLHTDAAGVETALAELNGRIEREGDMLAVRDWNEWQSPTTSTERVKRHRAKRCSNVLEHANIEVEEEQENNTTAATAAGDRWQSVEDAVRDSYAGKRTRDKRTGKRLAWVGNIIRVGGSKSRDDPALAVTLWREWWKSIEPKYRPVPERAADKWATWEPAKDAAWTL